MKKRFALVVCGVVGLSVVLSGCNLFVNDKAAYYSQAVATVSFATEETATKSIKITKEDLMQGYSRYGQTLQNNGLNGEELMDYLVDLLIDQKIVVNEVTNLIEQQKITITNNDKNEIWESTYESMLNLLKDYESDVIEDWKLDEPTADESEDKVKDEYKPFQPSAEIVYEKNEWKIKLIDNSDKSQKPLVYEEESGKTIKEQVVKTVKEELDKRISSNQVAKEAQKRYIYDLKNYQSGRGFSKVDVEIWDNEIQRVCQNVLDNKYLALYTEYLQKSSGNEQYSAISVNDVLTYVESKIKTGYSKYTTNPTSFNDDILGNRADTYYIMQNQELGEYFYVSHILVKFDDNAFTEIKNAYNAGYLTEEAYNAYREIIVNNTEVKSYGEKVGGYTVEKMYQDFAQKMNAAASTAEKMEVFNEFMYAYNEDEGNRNKDFDYVIGTKNSQMVESFTEAARKLYDNGNGKIGDISEMVESEYGVHILVYLGPVENLFDVTNIDAFSLTNASGAELENIITTLTTTRLSNLNTKTWFDAVYDVLATDNISILENLNLNTLKASTKITTYPSHYTDLY